MLEALNYDFMQNALMAGLLASLACGIIGALVVVNRLVFLAGGVAHTAYGGVGLAFFLGWPVLPCAVGFTLAASGVLAGATLHRSDRTDTVVGALWAGGMALGVLLVDLSPGYNVDLMSYLFGSILTAPRSDILIMAGLDLLLILLVFIHYKGLLAMSFDPEFARARGVPVAYLHFLLLAMTALTVVMLIQVVGLILIIALLTIPSYLGGRRAPSLPAMMFRAVLWAMGFCLAGLWAAYALNLTSGACIITVAALCFFLAPGLERLWRLVTGKNRAREAA